MTAGPSMPGMTAFQLSRKTIADLDGVGRHLRAVIFGNVAGRPGERTAVDYRLPLIQLLYLQTLKSVDSATVPTVTRTK